MSVAVTLLGTGGSAGLPQIGGADGRGDWGICDPDETRNRRTRASIVIHAPEGRILVDTAPELRLQLTDAGIGRIDALIFTHPHADHIAGFDEIRILNRIIDRPMPTYADRRTWDELRERFTYAFRPWAPPGFYRPVLGEHLIAPGETHRIAGADIEIIAQDHGFIPTLGLRVGDFAYCTDVVRFEPEAYERLRGVRIFVIDCFTRGRPHPTHANLRQVLAWVEELKPARTILTHMGPDMDFRTLEADLPDGVEPGYDGMQIEGIADDAG